MDEMTAFERQLSAELGEMAGPGRRIDGMAMVSAVATQSPTRRIQAMFSATKFVVAGAVVALLGGFLLAGLPSQPPSRRPGSSGIGRHRALPRLVYMLDGDVYVAEEDGTDPVRIVDGDADAECGASIGNRGLVSPDGRHIAYRSGGTTTVRARSPSSTWTANSSPRSREPAGTSPGRLTALASPRGSRWANRSVSTASTGPFRPSSTPHPSSCGATTTRGGPLMGRRCSSRRRSRPPASAVPSSRVCRSTAESPRSCPSRTPCRSARCPSRRTAPGSRPWARSRQLVVATLDGTPGGFEFYFTPGDKVDGGWARPPLWSPNGDRIAVVTRQSSTDAAGDPIQHSADLWVADPTTGLSTMVDSVVGDGDLRSPSRSRRTATASWSRGTTPIGDRQPLDRGQRWLRIHAHRGGSRRRDVGAFHSRRG